MENYTITKFEEPEIFDSIAARAASVALGTVALTACKGTVTLERIELMQEIRVLRSMLFCAIEGRFPQLKEKRYLVEFTCQHNGITQSPTNMLAIADTLRIQLK